MLAAFMQIAAAGPNETVMPEAKDFSPGENSFEEKSLNGKALQDMYGGIVTDQTITVAGQMFFQLFVSAWRDMPLHERYTLAVHERPSARWGNEVWVEYEQRRIFQAMLPPNRSNIKPMVEQAVNIAYTNAGNADVQRLLFRDPDIGPDEF